MIGARDEEAGPFLCQEPKMLGLRLSNNCTDGIRRRQKHGTLGLVIREACLMPILLAIGFLSWLTLSLEFPELCRC